MKNNIQMFVPVVLSPMLLMPGCGQQNTTDLTAIVDQMQTAARPYKRIFFTISIKD